MNFWGRVQVAALMVGFCLSAWAQNPNVTLTGKLQGPNGLPAANQLLTFTPTQTFFVAGLGSSSCNSYVISIQGTPLACADTINFNNSTPAPPTNGINVQWQTSKAGSTDSVSAAIVGDGNANHCLNGTGVFGNCLPSAQLGDIIRYNVNGDGAWDAVNATTLASWIVPDASGGSDFFNCFGLFVSQCVNDTKSSFSNVQPSVSAMYGRTLTSAASASTSTVVGMHSAQNGNNALAGIVSWYRFGHKIQIGNTTNARWWIGFGVYSGISGTGANTVQIDGTTAYAANVPNKTTIGFRYSNGTDTHWQCASIIAGSSLPSSTFVDTGVTPDTANPHIFEVASNAAGTSLFCLIDHVLVGTITTNIPAPDGTSNTLASPFFTGDNENTATAISATWYYTAVSYK